MSAPARSRKPWHRRWWHVAIKTVRGVTRLEDTPYRIAMGAACGLFTSCLPMLGQMLLGMLLARLLRANVLASVPWTWLTNPFTSLPIWYGCYCVGSAVIGRDPVTMEVISGFIGRIDEQGLLATIEHGGLLLGQIFIPLLLGTVLVGIILATAGYALIKPAVINLQRRRAERSRSWHLPAR